MQHRLQKFQNVLAGLLVGAAAAAAAVGAFSAGRHILLDSWPVLVLAAYLGLLFVAVRLLGSGAATSTAARLATVTWAAAVGVVLVRLAAASLVPPDERDIQTWHLWPLFTLIMVLAVTMPLILATMLVRLFSHRRPPADGPTGANGLEATGLFAAGLLVAAVLAVAAGPRVQTFLVVDACLDAGGAYSRAADECILTAPMPESDGHGLKPWVDFQSLSSGAAVSLFVVGALLALESRSESAAYGTDASR